MNLQHRIGTAIYDATGMLPVGALPGYPGQYSFAEHIITPFLGVIKIKPYQTPARNFKSDKLAADIKLAAELDQSEQVVIDIHKGFITIQIPRPANERGKTVYTSKEVPRGSGLRVSLGLDIFNEPVHYDFSRQMNTNISFLGVPGSGKSVSMRRTIVSLACNNGPDRVKFLMIEAAKDGLDLRMFSQLPHLIHPVVTDPAEAEHALNWIVAQTRRNGRLPFKLVVCIDEVAALVRQRPETVATLHSLVAEGRAVDVVNLLATQLTDRDTMGDGRAIFKQIHNVVLGKASSKQLSYLLSNAAGLKAEALTGEGDLLLRSNDGTARFAGAFTTASDMERLPRAETVSRLPIEDYTNTEAIKEGLETIIDEDNRAGQRNDNFTPEQYGVAIFEAPGVNKLQKRFSMGPNRAGRLRRLGQAIREWAMDNDHAPCFITEEFLELPSPGYSTIPPFHHST